MGATDETIAGLSFQLVRKDVKNISIRVLAPNGDVRVTAPIRTTSTTIDRVLVKRLDWILRKQEEVRNAPQLPVLENVSGERVSVWGQTRMLEVTTGTRQPPYQLTSDTLVLRLAPDSSQQKRQAFLDHVYRMELEPLAQSLIETWQANIGVQAGQVTIRKMKTRWGTCNPGSGKITLNLELAKVDPRQLEYVVVHELVHLLERGHNQRFYAFLDRYLPDWRVTRTELNSSQRLRTLSD